MSRARWSWFNKGEGAVADIEEIIRALKRAGTGGAENLMALTSGMAVQPVAGLNMVGNLLRGKGLDYSVNAGQTIGRGLTYQPQTDIGQRGQENIGAAIEPVGEAITHYGGFNKLGEQSPMLGALALGVANVAGPGGKGAPKPGLSKLLRDPGSPQALIPGLKPHSQETMAQIARDRYDSALRDASFEHEGAQYNFEPGNRTYTVAPSRQASGMDRPEYAINPREMVPASPGNALRSGNGRGAYMNAQPEMTQQAHAARMGVQGGFQRVLESLDNVNNAANEVAATGRPARAETAARQQDVIDRLRARRAPSMGPRDSFELERSIGLEKRDQPVIGETTDYMAGSSGYYNPMRPGAEAALVHELPEADRPALTAHRDRQRQQNILRQDAEDYAVQAEAEANKAPPEAPQPPWVADLLRTPSEGGEAPANRAWWNKALGVRSAEPYTGNPTLMNREAVEAFYAGGRDVPEMFEFGTAKQHAGARSLEEMVQSYADASGKDLRASIEEGGGYDEDWSPPALEHGRGELMRDRHGDHKGEERTHEPGDWPMYDESGDVKKVELKGPTQTGEPLMGKRKAEGGELKYDEYGDTEYDYKKSRGGETMRDEQGNIKYDEDAEPPYEERNASGRIYIPGKGGITFEGYGPDSEAHVNATRAGKEEKGGAGGVGSLAYQALLSDAVRSGNQIGVGSLYPDNEYRMLANANINYARHGENPRDVSYTAPHLSDALRVRRYAKGPEIWRAETAEARRRLGLSGVDPHRVLFDGESFSIDGNLAPPSEIKKRTLELSPHVGEGTGHSTRAGVGNKSLMRAAVFDWLRTATPEAAKAAAARWSKVGSPLFSVMGGVTLADVLRKKDDEAQYQ